MRPLVESVVLNRLRRPQQSIRVEDGEFRGVTNQALEGIEGFVQMRIRRMFNDRE